MGCSLMENSSIISSLDLEASAGVISLPGSQLIKNPRWLAKKGYHARLSK